MSSPTPAGVPLETNVKLSERLRSYLAAWVSLDPETVSQRYLEDGTHRGPGVIRMLPELDDATVRGRSALRDFVESYAPAKGTLKYKVNWVLETGETSVVEYEFMIAGRDRPGLATEVIEWSGEQVRSARAYLLAAPG